MTKKRTFREPLDPVWAETLLSVPSERSSDKTVAQVLDGLRLAFQTAVEDAQKILAEHPFAEVIATEAARRAGRRGDATVVVGDDGRVYLEVSYKTQRAATQPKPASDKPRPWSSDLPTIGELREIAKGLGLDPEPYGRSKVKLKDAIRKVTGAAPRPKMVRTGDALSPVTVLNPKPLPDMIADARKVDLGTLPPK
jgi:hypothetical protein